MHRLELAILNIISIFIFTYWYCKQNIFFMLAQVDFIMPSVYKMTIFLNQISNKYYIFVS